MPTADFERQVETTLESIGADPDIHPDNKDAIARFKRDLAIEALAAELAEPLGEVLGEAIHQALPDVDFGRSTTAEPVIREYH